MAVSVHDPFLARSVSLIEALQLDTMPQPVKMNYGIGDKTWSVYAIHSKTHREE